LVIGLENYGTVADRAKERVPGFRIFGRPRFLRSTMNFPTF